MSRARRSATRSAAADVRWPDTGVLRVHYDPASLPHLGDEPGGNRYDDPRPRTLDRFLIRYAATTLRGCLLELLAAFRDNTEANDRIDQVDDDDPDLVEPPETDEWQHIADFLDQRQVATLTGQELSTVSINDPTVQHQLDQEPAVRAVLDTAPARAALLERDSARVHLDNAAVRLASETGRYITQACALALYDRDARPDVIHYRSRHDDTEDCWAIYDHADVVVGTAEPFDPDVPSHVESLNAVAKLWDLPLPPKWRR